MSHLDELGLGAAAVVSQLQALGAKHVMIGGSAALDLPNPADVDIFVAAKNVPAVRDIVLGTFSSARMDKNAWAYSNSPFTSIRMGTYNILVCTYDYFDKVKRSIEILKFMQLRGVDVARKNVRVAVHEMVRGDFNASLGFD